MAKIIKLEIICEDFDEPEIRELLPQIMYDCEGILEDLGFMTKVLEGDK